MIKLRGMPAESKRGGGWDEWKEGKRGELIEAVGLKVMGRWTGGMFAFIGHDLRSFCVGF